MSTAVRPERILHELAELWVSLGKTETSGVLRACAMTLIVIVDTAEDAVAAGATLGELMHEHPSRAIVLKLEHVAREKLEARVFAQCWMPFGGRQQICCEQIEIASSCDRMAGVTPVVLGIMAPDLPVVIWSRSARILELPEFEQLLPLARKIIVDSRDLGPPAEALRRVRSLGAGRREVADLEWTRLTRFRETIAGTFDDPKLLDRLRQIERITIRHGSAQPLGGAYYLGAWLHSVIGERCKLDFQRTGAPDDPVSGVELMAGDWKASFQLADGTLAVNAGGMRSRVAAASLSDYTLLREELSILEADTIFERALDAAIIWAGKT